MMVTLFAYTTRNLSRHRGLLLLRQKIKSPVTDSPSNLAPVMASVT